MTTAEPVPTDPPTNGEKGTDATLPEGKQPAEDDVAEGEAAAGEGPAPDVPSDDDNAEGLLPLFLTSTTQSILKVDVDEESEDLFQLFVKTKADLLGDIQYRGVISDFHVAKEAITAYPEDELLLVYDSDSKFGENFFLCITKEARERRERLARGLPAEEEKAGEEAEDYSAYDGATADKERDKKWKSGGSEKEIDAQKIENSRELVRAIVSRKRRQFGAMIKFDSRDSIDCFTECRPYKDPNYDLRRKEVDSGIQAGIEVNMCGTQTMWNRQVDVGVQYEANVLPEEEAKQISESEPFQTFLGSVSSRVEDVLKQNACIDTFADDYGKLSEEDGAVLGSKGDTSLREFQSFASITYCRGRRVSAIQWQPRATGVLALSVVSANSLEMRVSGARKLEPTHILFWSFVDPIHPQLILEAPDDVICFEINSTQPNLVVAGLANGQICVWDISAYLDRLRTRVKVRAKAKSAGTGDAAEGQAAPANTAGTGAMDSARGGDGDDAHEPGEVVALVSARSAQSAAGGTAPGGDDDTPIVRWHYLSRVEGGHLSGVTSVHWLPADVEMTAQKHFTSVDSASAIPDGEGARSFQVVSTGTDGQLLFWDMRLYKQPRHLRRRGRDMLTEAEFRDMNWSALARFKIGHPDVVGTALSLVSLSTVKSNEPYRLWCGTAEGEFCELDCTRQNATDGGADGGDAGLDDGAGAGAAGQTDTNEAGDSSMVVMRSVAHAGPCVALQRSPHLPAVFATAGDHTFRIWKEGEELPLMESSDTGVAITALRWSPSRPGVLAVGKSDGFVEIWDLLDRSHEASLSQNISSHVISSLEFWKRDDGKRVSGHRAHQTFLAAGDENGTVHVLELPRILAKPIPNEVNVMDQFWQRESVRVEYYRMRRSIRDEQVKADERRRREEEKAADALATGAGSGLPSAPSAAMDDAASTEPSPAAILAEWRAEEEEFMKLLEGAGGPGSAAPAR